MMLTAGIITIVFKKIKQPLILGYILAGFIQNVFICLALSVLLMTATLLVIEKLTKKTA